MKSLGKGYFYYLGNLIRRDDRGDTLFPGNPGRYTILEPTSSKTDALKKAKAWKDEDRHA